MKKVIAGTLLALVVSQGGFARESKATVFGSVAKDAVKSMYGRKGDSIAVTLKEMNQSGDVVTETWEVSLSNGADVGSALYEVTVAQKNGAVKEGQEVATVKIKYITGN